MSEDRDLIVSWSAIEEVRFLLALAGEPRISIIRDLARDVIAQ